MIVFPAIDLRAGRVVRLQQGRAEAETVYGEDPARTAAEWQRQGAQWLHVVNLDGAFGDNSGPNGAALAQIVKTVNIPIQFGGGLRTIEDVDAALALGVGRVVIGTAAVEKPELVSEAVQRYGSERVAVGIDVRDGMVATRGWRDQSHIAALDLARQMRDRGVRRIIYTDIARDGMLQGIDAAAVAKLARGSGVGVIASGGVAGLADIESLRARAGEGIEGVIIGQALYSGRVMLSEALEAAREPKGANRKGMG